MACALALAGHALALLALRQLVQPPSILRELAPPMYTRTLVPEAPATPPPAVAAAAEVSRPNRPFAQIRRAQAAPKKAAKKPRPPDPLGAASAAEPAVPPTQAASAPLPEAPDDVIPAPAEVASAPEAAPPPEAVASAPAYVDSWPRDTRLRYQLGGYYRGELHGDAQVLWQRVGTRYQAVVHMDVGLLLSSRFTSQGEITERGLRPERYEEQVRQRRRGVHLGEDVRLNNGTRVPRPEDVQDAASQFVELGHRFATGQLQLTPGGQINFWLARPGGVDEWTYDVIGEETLHLPRLGPVAAVHLKPRPLAKPRGPIMAEIWFAPSLQYLPVRIKITQGPDTYIDLLVDTVEQQ